MPDGCIIDSLDRLGTVHSALGHCEKAKANARSAAKRLKAAPQFEEQLRTRVFGNLKKAKMMLKVMQAKESDDVPAQILLAEKLGDLNADLLRHKDAIAQYRICAQLMEGNGSNASARAPIYSSLAITFYESGNLKQAIRYHTKELEMHRQTGNRKEEADTLIRIAEYLNEIKAAAREDADDAGQSLVKVIEYLESARSALDTAVGGAVDGDDGTLRSLLPLAIDVETKLQGLYSQVGQPECMPKSVTIMSAMQGRLDALLVVDEDADDEDGEDSPAPGTISDVSITDSEPESIVEEDMANTAVVKSSKTGLEKPNDVGETPLHKACVIGNIGRVKSLLEKGANINVTDNYGYSPLHEACSLGHTEIVKLLLAHPKVRVDWTGRNICQKEGLTPLHDAAKNLHLECQHEIVELLVEKNADIFLKNNKGQHALTIAAKYANNNNDPTFSFLKAATKDLGETPELDNVDDFESEYDSDDDPTKGLAELSFLQERVVPTPLSARQAANRARLLMGNSDSEASDSDEAGQARVWTLADIAATHTGGKVKTKVQAAPAGYVENEEEDDVALPPNALHLHAQGWIVGSSTGSSDDDDAEASDAESDKSASSSAAPRHRKPSKKRRTRPPDPTTSDGAKSAPTKAGSTAERSAYRLRDGWLEDDEGGQPKKKAGPQSARKRKPSAPRTDHKSKAVKTRARGSGPARSSTVALLDDDSDAEDALLEADSPLGFDAAAGVTDSTDYVDDVDGVVSVEAGVGPSTPGPASPPPRATEISSSEQLLVLAQNPNLTMSVTVNIVDGYDTIVVHEVDNNIDSKAMRTRIRDEYERLYGVVLKIRRLADLKGRTLKGSDRIRMDQTSAIRVVVVVESCDDTRRFDARLFCVKNALGRTHSRIAAALDAVVNRTDRKLAYPTTLDFSGHGLCGHGADVVCRLLRHSAWVTVLEFSDSCLDDSDMETVAEALGSIGALQILNLCSNRFTATGCQHLFSAKSPGGGRPYFHLRALDLSHNYLLRLPGNALTQFFRAAPQLRSLALDYCGVSASALTKALATVDSGLLRESVSVSGGTVDSHGTTVAALATRTARLDFSNVVFADIDVPKVYAPAPEPSSEDLSVVSTGMECSTEILSTMLAALQAQAKRLRHLDLSFSSLSSDSVQALVHGALPTHAALSTLKLTGNPIGVEGCRHLNELLRKAPELATLDVSECQLDMKCAVVLLQALAKDSGYAPPRLSEMYLQDNIFDPAESETLATALQPVGCLARLDLSGHVWADRRIQTVWCSSHDGRIVERESRSALVLGTRAGQSQHNSQVHAQQRQDVPPPQPAAPANRDDPTDELAALCEDMWSDGSDDDS